MLPHYQPGGPGSDLINTLQARVRVITSVSAWHQRMTRVVDELRDQLAGALDDNARLHEEVLLWRRLAARHMGLPPIPEQYIHAVRTGGEVSIEIDGAPCIVGAALHPPGIDPRRELEGWAQLVAAVRSARSEVGHA